MAGQAAVRGSRVLADRMTRRAIDCGALCIRHICSLEGGKETLTCNLTLCITFSHCRCSPYVWLLNCNREGQTR